MLLLICLFWLFGLLSCSESRLAWLLLWLWFVVVDCCIDSWGFRLIDFAVLIVLNLYLNCFLTI